MSRENIYSSSTILDGLNHSISDVNEGHQDQFLNDIAHRTPLDNDAQSNFTDLTSISQKSDEDRKQILSRWDDCLNKKFQTQSVANQQNYPTDQNTIAQPSLDKVAVREFLPRTIYDSILPILRELFVRSFDEFYKEIEAQLKLKTNKTVVEWLQETFDEIQDDLLTKNHRCFILYSIDEALKNNSKQGIIGFLTLKEEEKGSVYIAQCAIEAENKRRGYGARLFQHLRTIYPPGTFYWGLCRRANIPAVKFYLKQGATYIGNEGVATKYGYNTELYTGFQFTDGMQSSQTGAPDPPVVPFAPPTITPSSSSVLKRRSHVSCKDNSTMTDPPSNIEKRKLHNRKSCCVIS